VSSEIYNHFMLLSVSISMLVDPCLCCEYVDFANSLLNKYVKQFDHVYPTCPIYNIHCLSHLANDVKMYGPLDNFAVSVLKTIYIN